MKPVSTQARPHAVGQQECFSRATLGNLQTCPLVHHSREALAKTDDGSEQIESIRSLERAIQYICSQVWANAS